MNSSSALVTAARFVRSPLTWSARSISSGSIERLVAMMSVWTSTHHVTQRISGFKSPLFSPEHLGSVSALPNLPMGQNLVIGGILFNIINILSGLIGPLLVGFESR